MGLPTLDDGQKLLACLAVAVRARDPVLVKQIAERVDHVIPEAQVVKTFGRLGAYGLTAEDMDWLEALEL